MRPCPICNGGCLPQGSEALPPTKRHPRLRDFKFLTLRSSLAHAPNRIPIYSQRRYLLHSASVLQHRQRQREGPCAKQNPILSLSKRPHFSKNFPLSQTPSIPRQAIQIWASRAISPIISVFQSPSMLPRLTSRLLQCPTSTNAMLNLSQRLQLSRTLHMRISTTSLKCQCALLKSSRLLMQSTKSPPSHTPPPPPQPLPPCASSTRCSTTTATPTELRRTTICRVTKTWPSRR